MIVPHIPTTQWESNYHAATMALARIQRLLVEADDEARRMTPLGGYPPAAMAAIVKRVNALEGSVEAMHGHIMDMAEDANDLD